MIPHRRGDSPQSPIVSPSVSLSTTGLPAPPSPSFYRDRSRSPSISSMMSSALDSVRRPRRQSDLSGMSIETSPEVPVPKEPEVVDWSLTRSLKKRTLTFEPAQERVYYKEHLAPSARTTLLSAYFLGILILLGEIGIELFNKWGKLEMRTIYYAVSGLAVNMVGIIFLTWNKGTLFGKWYKSPSPSRKRHHFLGLDARYLAFAPLSLFFLGLIVQGDLQNPAEIYSVTGSSYPYVVLLTAAGTGLIFTHPVVWFPLITTLVIVVARCVLIVASMLSAFWGRPVLGYRAESIVNDGSTMHVAFACIGAVLLYLSPTLVAIVPSYRLARLSEKEHRQRFVQTMIVQQDRDQFSREKDRSGRLLKIVFPEPIIRRILDLKTHREDGALNQSERALLGNVDGDLSLHNEQHSMDTDNKDIRSQFADAGLQLADRINNVGVAFVDFYTPEIFAGIGGVSSADGSTLPPCRRSRAHARRAVALLNLTFAKFDALLEKYPNIEKIKTVGTKVIIAVGLFDTEVSFSGPSSDDKRQDTQASHSSKGGHRYASTSSFSSAERISSLLNLIMETIKSMQYYEPGELDDLYYEEEGTLGNPHGRCTCPGGRGLDVVVPRCLRAGIASGTVVAGIVGSDMFCYDFWSDCVNTSSRMLSVAAKNEVIVTEEIRDKYKLLQSDKVAKVLGVVRATNALKFDSLGSRTIKGKGNLQIFSVLGSPHGADNYPVKTPSDGDVRESRSNRRRPSQPLQVHIRLTDSATKSEKKSRQSERRRPTGLAKLRTANPVFTLAATAKAFARDHATRKKTDFEDGGPMAIAAANDPSILDRKTSWDGSRSNLSAKQRRNAEMRKSNPVMELSGRGDERSTVFVNLGRRSSGVDMAASLSLLVSNILEEFYSIPTSKLSHAVQYSKLSMRLHPFLIRFRDAYVERVYREGVRSRTLNEINTLKFLWVGCIASLVACIAAGSEIFLGGPPSVDLTGKPVPANLPVSPSYFYWCALGCLLLHVASAVAVSLDTWREERITERKKRSKRRGVVVPAQMGEFNEL